MEEAERLCDRVMVVDGGRVVAIDTPSGLVERFGGGQKLRFRPSPPIPEADIAALPEVSSVTSTGDFFEVAGNGNLIHAVTALLAQRGVIAEELRIEQSNLEDAYLDITRENR
jgi:ABC-2 type transport system ATP-binding protein